MKKEEKQRDANISQREVEEFQKRKWREWQRSNISGVSAVDFLRLKKDMSFKVVNEYQVA